MIDGAPRREPTSTSALTRVAAVIVVSALVGGLAAASITRAVGAGGGAPDKTIPTPPGSTDVITTDDTVSSSTAPLTTDEPSTSDVPVTSQPVDTGIALSANAQISEMFGLSSQLIGPTSDVAASLRAFAAIPEGIPSPVDSTIEEFSINYYGEFGYYSADAVFTSSAEPDDVVVFYETTLTAAGFTLRRDDVQTDPDTQIRTHTLEFAPPESDFDGAAVRVVIDFDDEPRIFLEVTDSVSPETLAAFGGWARGIPAVGEGVAISAGLSLVSTPNLILTVRTEFLYDGRTTDELTAEVRDSLADSPAFRIAEDDEGGSEIRMTHRIIVDPVAEISDNADGDATMFITGSLQI